MQHTQRQIRTYSIFSCESCIGALFSLRASIFWAERCNCIAIVAVGLRRYNALDTRMYLDVRDTRISMSVESPIDGGYSCSDSISKYYIFTTYSISTSYNFIDDKKSDWMN